MKYKLFSKNLYDNVHFLDMTLLLKANLDVKAKIRTCNLHNKIIEMLPKTDNQRVFLSVYPGFSVEIPLGISFGHAKNWIGAVSLNSEYSFKSGFTQCSNSYFDLSDEPSEEITIKIANHTNNVITINRGDDIASLLTFKSTNHNLEITNDKVV